MERRAYEEMAAVEATHWWFVARRRILADTIARMNLPAGARILEVGAGTGGNLAMLSEFGAVSAIEMDADARRHAERTTGMTVSDGHVPGAIRFAGDERFDLVCLFDVLEHIEDDVGALSCLKGLLAPGGRLLVTVPAYQWMWSPHDVLHHHRRRYTRRSLARTMAGAGFTAADISYFNTFLFPLAAAIRLAGRVMRRGGSPGTAIPGRPANTVLRSVFASERHVLPHARLPFGLSLLAEARPA